jgi:hypothetical protein
MATHITAVYFALVAGVFLGVRSFFRGFPVYREYLRIRGIPAMSIRSIAMGLVRIHGKAASDSLLTSPIGHKPCCFYQVRIEEWREQGYDEERGTWTGAWEHYGVDSGGESFYLEDNSGRVLVAPRGAEFQIEFTAIRSTSGLRHDIGAAAPRETSAARTAGAAALAAIAGASEAELLSYVAHVGPSPETPGGWRPLVRSKELLDTIDQAKRATLEIQAETVQALEAQGPQSDPLSEELRLADIELQKHPFWSSEYTAGLNRVTKLQARVRKAGFGIGIPAPPQRAPTADEIVASIDGPLYASGRYRFTECCVLPDHEYDVTGTCALNPDAKDANDRNLIRKGAKETLFVISGLAGPKVNSMPQFRAYSMIFGGGMLAVFCLGILLQRLGQF